MNLYRSFTRILSIFGLICLLFSCKSVNPYDELRLRQFEKITGGDLDLSDSLVIKRHAAMDAGVRTSWTDMNKDPQRKYLWNDRDCVDDSISPFRPASITSSLGRLSWMATAYATKGSTFYKDEKLKKDIIDGMEWMYEHKWSPKYPLYGNWWDWIIGMPNSVNNMLIVMYDDFTPEQRAKYIEALDFYAPGVTYEGASTGANKIWQCSSMVLRGILAHDETKIKMGVDGIDTEFKYVDTHDGFYKDGSYLQHQWHPYTGGYGAGFLRDVVNLMGIVHGSKWAVSDSHMGMLCEWIENSYLPLIYNGAMMDMVRGREIARQAASDRATGHSILWSAYNVSKMVPEDVKNRLQPLIKYEMKSDTFRDFLTYDVPLWQLKELRAFLNDNNVPATPPAPYHKQFSMMDRVVHVRPGFAVGLAMSSNRIENYESIDSENMMAWHVGDGMTYIYNGDQAQYTDHFWSTIDYYRLPGITVDVQQHEVKSLIFGKGVLYADGYKSPKTWVGGSSIEKSYGISGMWFDDEKSTLEAKKTWFMVGDEITALGAGINSKDNRTIETIIDNRKINGTSRVTVEGEEALKNYGKLTQFPVSWAHFATTSAGTDMGYYFPNQAEVQFQKLPRTGSWRDFSKYGDPTPVTRDYYTIWFDHGKNPTNAKYAYVLLPGKNAAEVKSYASEPNVEILSNTPQVQAVKAKKEGVTGLNFWEVSAKPVAGISVSAPASVILHETDAELVIGVSDPTQLYAGEITVETDKTVKEATAENPNVKVLSVSPLKLQVNVKGGMGQTFSVTFKK